MFSALQKRHEQGRPIRVALIGAGKFATMYLHQARRTPGVHVCAVCDLSPERASNALLTAGWSPQQIGAADVASALERGSTWIGDDVSAALRAPVEVVIEATGDPLAGAAHALTCIDQGLHVVMVNVEADVLVGPRLAQLASQAGVVYSMAFGDQPALIADMVDWARVCGLRVVCAGKGTKYLPAYHQSTPDTVWEHYGLTAEEARAGGMNPTMFNSFLDGTKSGIEMAAVANACDLQAPEEGLQFPPSSANELAEVLRPRDDTGRGRVEVVSSLTRNGEPIENDLRWGVYVTFAGDTEYARRCFREYGMETDRSGEYCALYRPTHLIGLELGVSVASAALRGEPTGTPRAFNADVVAVAKRDLDAGQVLDGEGGYTVWGRIQPAAAAHAVGALPLGLCKGARLKSAVACGGIVKLADVEVDQSHAAWQLRGDMARTIG